MQTESKRNILLITIVLWELIIIKSKYFHFFKKTLLVQTFCKQFTSCKLYNHILIKSSNQCLQCIC